MHNNMGLEHSKAHLVLGSELLGSVNHVGQRSLGLLPTSGLQTTVWVDPELVRRVDLQDLLDSGNKLLLGRNSWRVNVEQTQTNVVRVVRKLSDVVGVILLGELDGHNVSIQGLDVVRVQVGVAEVRVDLGRVCDTRSGHSERLRGPVQVVRSFLASSQWQTFSDGWLVDLNDSDTCSFQVSDFVSQGQTQLQRLHLLRNVVSWERPSKTCDWTGQHTLDWQLGQRLSVNGLLDGHGLWSRDITDNDWWSDVSGTVRLDPTVGGENVTVQLLTKVLHHVVSLWLTVHQDVQTNLLLESDDSLDFSLDELLVLLLGDSALGELVSVDSNVLCLRERTNSGGWEQRQVVLLLLSSQSGWEWRLSGRQRLVDSGHSLLHLRVGGDRRLLSGLDGLGVGSVNGRNIFTRSFLGNRNNSVQLLSGKSEPVSNHWVQLGLVLQVHWGVQQRGRSGDNNSVSTELLDSLLNHSRSLGVVGLPDVSTVNNTNGQNLLGVQDGDNIIELLGTSDKVKVETRNRQALDGSQVRSDVTKVGGQDDFWQAFANQLLESGLVQFSDRLRQVQNQNRFVNSHGLGAGLVQLGQQRLVNWQELLQKRNRLQVQRVLVGLTQVQVGDWTQHNWSGLNAQLLGLQVFDNRLQTSLGVQLELGGVRESWSDIVVVGVKPLDHFQSSHVNSSLGLGGLSLQTSAHGEQNVNWSQVVLLVSVWDDIEQERQVQNSVVEGKVVGGDDVDTSILLQLPVVGSQFFTLGQQVVNGNLLVPVSFGDFLQLSSATNTGET
ncbi:conserved hypothetical protein [Clavispora lusitaniae ATCC 42720]|uniref:Uncharacterized protein n=1 Tax=Clavispora lusitaniae (strain ATCC 42720) TaxID=306902 RepID=C4XWS1_CLAL4|nr:uncharacterized protein CLUG_00394 [Clavispora lusitaniae ATCC 42720]EEQ36271.1 conserved hypothetical protein [Clavispora lusitaniae ATCC 42720]